MNTKTKICRRINLHDKEEKQCIDCLKWFEVNEENFSVISKNKDGLNNRCRKCQKIKNDKYYEKTKEIQKEKARERIKNNPEYNRTKALEHYNKKRDKEIIRLKNWRQENKEHKQQYQLNYQRNNPDKIKEYSKDRQHKNHKITKKEWEACLQYFNYECAYCGLKQEDHYNMYMGKLRKENLNKEHVEHEGKNDLSNCIPACKSCNDRKWKHNFNEWYNQTNINYTDERYNKIIKWLQEDYKKYIIKKDNT